MPLFLLVLVVLAEPIPPAPFVGDEDGGGAEPEEGGRDLERERDAGEGARRVMWACEGVDGRKGKGGRSASYCVSPGG
jgi:hypothetical protein